MSSNNPSRSIHKEQVDNAHVDRQIKEAVDFDKAISGKDFPLDLLGQAEKTITIKPFITYNQKTNEITTCHPELAELVRMVTNGNPALLQALVRSKEGIRKAILRDQGAWLRTILLAKNVALLDGGSSKDIGIATKNILAIMKSLPDGGPVEKLPKTYEDIDESQVRAAREAGGRLLHVETESETL